jgi:hypothetical protein
MRSTTEPQNGTPLPSPTRKQIRGVVKGKIHSAVRILVFGIEGVGKSTLGSKAENPVFIGSESGTEQLDVERLPQPTHWTNAPEDEFGDRNDVLSLTDRVRFGDHDWKTLVVDTLDWVEPLLWKYVCDSDPDGYKNPSGSIVLAYGGYGKGFDVAINHWRAWLAQLDAIRKERNMNILLLAHSHIKTFRNPEGDDFDRYQLKMNDKASGIIKEWSDAVLFANQKISVTKKDTAAKNEKKRYGIGSMTHMLYTQRRPAWDAKNRFGLPEEMALSWPDLMKYIRVRGPEDVHSLVEQIKEQVGFMSTSNQTEAMAAIERAGQDPEKLSILLNWVQANQPD